MITIITAWRAMLHWFAVRRIVYICRVNQALGKEFTFFGSIPQGGMAHGSVKLQLALDSVDMSEPEYDHGKDTRGWRIAHPPKPR